MGDMSWDLVLFFGGFSFGVLATVAGLVAARIRRQAATHGDLLIQKMGPLAARRFIEAASE